MKLTPDFDSSEFECPCPECASSVSDKTVVPISMALVSLLQEIRNKTKFPMKVNSGVRCYSHNVAVHGRPASSHLKGLAADIAIFGSHERDRLLELSYEVGFKRRGVYESFIHLDVDSDKSQGVCWVPSK